MNNTKLEEYIAVTKVVAHHGPLTFKQIEEQTKIDGEKLKEQLSFLVDQGVINSQKTAGKKATTYVASIRGVKVLKFFSLNEPIKNDLNNLYP
jgi:transcription initiation factor IIE alpha subunit